MAEVRLKFSADTANIQQGISKVSASINKLKGIAGSVSKAFGAMVPVAGIASALGGLGIGAAVMDVLDYGGALADLSNITDIAVSDLVVLQEEFRQAGIDAGSLQKVMGQMSSKLSNPSTKILTWLKQLGLSAEELKGMTLADQFNTIGSAIGGLDSTTQKIAASQAFFGKSLGTSLVNLFKTGEAAKDAKEYVGQLGITMEKNVNAFDRAGDIIAGVNTKVRQFFAAFVGANIDRLTEITDAFAKMDLTNFGKSFGETADKIIDTLIQAFKQGKLWETLWNGFSATIRKTGELLISVFELAAQHMARALEDSLRGSKMGDYLGIKRDTKRTLVNPETGQEMNYFLRQYNAKVPDKFGDIMNRNSNLLGGEDALNRFFEPLKSAIPKPPVVPDAAKETEAIFKEIFEFSDSVRNAMLGNSADILMTKGVKRIPVPDDKTAFQPDAFKPVLSSLARIGGASAFTRNPLIPIQQRGNQLLEIIANNTSKKQNSTVPSWG